MSLRKVTQRELADKINISSTAMSQAIKREDFKISMLEDIAKALRVTVSYFFEDKEEILTENNYLENDLLDSVKNQLQMENNFLKKENELLQNTIKDKNQFINLLNEKILGYEAMLKTQNDKQAG